MTQVGEKQKQVRKDVYTLMDKYEDTRNSDKALLLRYWSEIEGIVFDYTFPQSFVEKSQTTPESITRARREIQSAGFFMATDPDVVRQRRQKQEEMRQHYTKN